MGNLDKIEIIKKLRILNDGTIFWFDLGAIATLNFSDGIYVRKSESMIQYINKPQSVISINKIDFSKGVNETHLEDLFKYNVANLEFTTANGSIIAMNNVSITEDNGFLIVKTSI